jgi:cysteinyl-tRNA synthetase
VLWKPSKPGEPAWPSLKGIAALGRPGWHIECSAMADKCLWDEPRLRGLLSEAGLNRPHVFDIHGGGIDLVFPHHENEIAQSRCGHGTDRMANIWMHNGFLQVEGEKMSKSLGNFVTIRELLREWPGDVIRLQMLMTHYTQPLDWTAERCKEAARELQYWGNDVASLFGAAAGVPSKELVVALADDLNTPQAITVLRDRATKAKKGDVREARLLAEDCKFLGLRNLHLPGLFESGVLARDAEQRDLIAQRDRVQGLRAALANNDVDLERQHRLDIEQGGFRIEVHQRGNITLLGVDKAFTARVSSRVAARNAARKAKNFQEADRIRDELSAMGIQLKDAKNPTTGEIETTWEIKR